MKLPFRDHWTPQYIASRITVAGRQRLRPDEPWLTAKALRLIGQSISATGRGVEFGCGASTLWLAARCAHLVSVEHDPEWYDRCAARLADARIGNVDLRLCRTGREYEGEIDFGLIDGKRRAVTALKVAEKLRPGGLLILDNADRYIPARDEAWRAFARRVEGWRYVPTSNGVWRTDLWYRPDIPETSLGRRDGGDCLN